SASRAAATCLPAVTPSNHDTLKAAAAITGRCPHSPQLSSGTAVTAARTATTPASTRKGPPARDARPNASGYTHQAVASMGSSHTPSRVAATVAAPAAATAYAGNRRRSSIAATTTATSPSPATARQAPASAIGGTQNTPATTAAATASPADRRPT